VLNMYVFTMCYMVFQVEGRGNGVRSHAEHRGMEGVFVGRPLACTVIAARAQFDVECQTYGKAELALFRLKPERGVVN